MSAKEVKLGVEARDRMLRGVDILNNAVKVTHGRSARPVTTSRQALQMLTPITHGQSASCRGAFARDSLGLRSRILARISG